MDVSRVDHDIATGEFFRMKFLLATMDGVKKRGKALHLMGLISDGQVILHKTSLRAASTRQTTRA